MTVCVSGTRARNNPSHVCSIPSSYYTATHNHYATKPTTTTTTGDNAAWNLTYRFDTYTNVRAPSDMVRLHAKAHRDVCACVQMCCVVLQHSQLGLCSACDRCPNNLHWIGIASRDSEGASSRSSTVCSYVLLYMCNIVACISQHTIGLWAYAFYGPALDAGSRTGRTEAGSVRERAAKLRTIR